MAKFGGFGGGNPMQMQNMLRQAQKLQEEAMEAQRQVDEAIVSGSASGGLVSVLMHGDKTVTEIKINPSVVDPDDVEMLEGLILAAINDASANADKLKAEKLGKFSSLGGLM